jgi:hypothetical protein
MLRSAIKKVIATTGYELVRKQSPSHLLRLFSYTDEQGHFDYARYRRVQESGNKQKLSNVWATEENIKFLANYLSRKIGSPSFGLCHGTRRGLEQEWFQKYLGGSIIGTEISETATQFPNTIQWDFHEIKDEWINSVDFIYSNSFDHSYDPEYCLKQWIECVKPGHPVILEHTSDHGPQSSCELDPFGVEFPYLVYLITKWGKGDFFVSQILEAPEKPRGLSFVSFVIIEKRA